MAKKTAVTPTNEAVKPMKTLANCSNMEFIAKANEIKGDVENFLRVTKINDIRKEVAPLTGKETDEEKEKIIKDFNHSKWDRIFKACMTEHTELTYDLVAKMCFSTREEIEALSPWEFQLTAVILLGDSRINDFFTGLRLSGLLDTD
jgi:hypothetical protein